MKKLNLFIMTSWLLSLAPYFSQSQAPTTLQSELLTIDQAVAEALEKNLGLLAERYNLTIADARIVAARLRPNPVLSLGADTLDLLGTGFDPQTNAGGPSNYSIRTDFLLERGGKRQARIAVAEGNRAVAQLQLLNTVRGIVLDVQNAFVDLQSAKDSLGLAQENLQTLHDIVGINEKRVKNGDLAEVELLRAQVAELQFENSVRQAELRGKTAKAKLQILLGRIRNARPFDIVGELRRDSTLPNQEALLTQAQQMRPDLLALARDQARSQAEIRNQLALGKVDYTIGSQYLRQADTAHTNTLGFFFQTNIPIFNRNQGEIERARQEQRQIEARIRAMEATVENDVEIAYQQYATAQATLEKVERTMVGKARDVRSITEYSYKRGDATFVEFLDAQRAYNDTMQAHNDARADFARSLYGIDAAIGTQASGGSRP
jgi:cobalt-zinc-cadmium efflux system outer membrane protein